MEEKPTKIILTNQHCDNRGDESATIGLIEQIYNNFGNDAKIVMLKQTQKHQFIQKKYGITELDMSRSICFLLQICLWIVFKFIKIDIRFILSSKTKNFIKLHKDADIVLSSCGGPYIGDIYFNHEILHILYVLVPQLLGKKVVFAAPSMGPFNIKIANPIRKYILRKADLIVLRDKVSYDYVIKFLKDSKKVVLASDACFANELDGKKLTSERKNIIGFTPLEYKYSASKNPSHEIEKYKRCIVTLFDQLMNEDKDLAIEFFPQLYNKHTDIPLIKDIISRMKYGDRTIIFSDKKSGIEQQKEIATLKLMIATRYHSAVFSCKMGVPVICIAYEHKAVAMMESFKLSECVIDINELNSRLLLDKYNYVVENYQEIYKKQIASLPKITDYAKRTILFTKKIFNKEEIDKSEVANFYDDIEINSFLCHSCGMCVSVCPSDALSIKQNEYKQPIPSLNVYNCINCKRCIESCMVRNNTHKSQTVTGPYRGILIAKSTNKLYNKLGASGGVVTSLIDYGLKNKYFDSVLTVDNIKSPVVAEPVFVKEGIESLAGSKYISSPLCTMYKNTKEKLIITALPCQAKTIRKQNKQAFIFGLFCSQTSSEDLINFFENKFNISSELEEVKFRKGKWPGNLSLKYKNGEEKTFPLNRSVFGAAYNSYYFANSGCLLCDDYFAEDADISFGDPWGKKQYVNNYNGETLVIIRSEKGQELVNAAIKDNIIEAKDYEIEQLIKGHIKEIYNKKTALKQRLNYVRELTNAMDEYNEKTLIGADNFKLLNKYSMHNNWVLRRRGRYKKIFKKSFIYIFTTRYVHAYLLGKCLNKSKNAKVYLDIAVKEKL